MANLHDVARKANVSKTLVSRVINNQKGVSKESEERILAAMRELNYVPNKLARALVLGKTFNIGVVMDSLCEPYFFELFDGIESEVERSNYHVMFCSGHNSPSTKEAYIDLFASGSTDGVIIYGSNREDTDLLLRKSQSNFPIVVVENELTLGQVNNVIVANANGSRIMVEYLYSIGCRHIIHVAGPHQHMASQQRLEGFIRSSDRLGIRYQVLECEDFCVRSGYDVIVAYLEQTDGSALPDAIYFSGDVLAYGGMMALEERGIRIPEDIRIAGFDDEPASNYGLTREFVPLTTMRQPLFDMGSEAVRLLLKQIENPQISREKVVFQPELILRASTVK